MIERISVNHRIHFGKPCVAGTRITVQSVLELLNEGLSFQEIRQDYYPDLSIEDIRACIQYAIALIAAEDGILIHASKGGKLSWEDTYKAMANADEQDEWSDWQNPFLC